MNKRPTFTPKQRQLIPLQSIPSTKRPYLVRDLADTVLYLTQAQADNRFDLIPQFAPLPVPPQSQPSGWIESDQY